MPEEIGPTEAAKSDQEFEGEFDAARLEEMSDKETLATMKAAGITGKRAEQLLEQARKNKGK